MQLSFITDNSPSDLKWEILEVNMSGNYTILESGGLYKETGQSIHYLNINKSMSSQPNKMYMSTLSLRAYELNEPENSNLDENESDDLNKCVALRDFDGGFDGLRSPGHH